MTIGEVIIAITLRIDFVNTGICGNSTKLLLSYYSRVIF